jgi:hypothetical protein
VIFKLSLKPLGFVIATGLHPLVSETASLLSECLRLRSTTNWLLFLLHQGKRKIRGKNNIRRK